MFYSEPDAGQLLEVRFGAVELMNGGVLAQFADP